MTTRSMGDVLRTRQNLDRECRRVRGEASDFFGVGSVDGGDFDSGMARAARAWVSVMLPAPMRPMWKDIKSFSCQFKF